MWLPKSKCALLGGIRFRRQKAKVKVVVWTKKAITKVWYVTVTFLQEINGVPTALYSVYAYDSGVNRLTLVGAPAAPRVRYPQLVCELGMPCETPNVDQGTRGNLVFVFGSKGSIYARARSLSPVGAPQPTTTPFPLHQVNPGVPTLCFSGEEKFYCLQPDVSIWEAPASQGIETVHYTYVQKSKNPTLGGNYQRVLVQTENLATAAQGPGGNVSCADVKTVYLYYVDPDDTSAGGIVSYPRITSVCGTAPATDRRDFVVTVSDHRTPPAGNDSWYVITAARQNGILQSPIGVNIRGAAGQYWTGFCYNVQPVVAMWMDIANPVNGAAYAVCDWAYKSSHLQCINGNVQGYEVLGQALKLDGSVYPSVASNGIAQVNQTVSGNQRTPSVAGGHGSAQDALIPNILHVWFDESDGTIRYKDAAPDAQNFRPAHSSISVGSGSIAPNPADATSVLTLTVADDERVTDLILVESTTGQPLALGHPLLNDRLNQETSGSLTWPLGEWLKRANAHPGLYAVRVQTTHGERSVRFSYQPK